jgi:DNA-binding beta-propeller fold protein YncE
MRIRTLARLCIAAAVAFGAAASAADAPPLERLFVHGADFPLGAATDRMDHESLDAATGRLFIAKMGAGRLLVFDTQRNSLLKDMPGFLKITGVLAVVGKHRLYASVPGAGIGPSVSVGLGMVGLSEGTVAIAVLDTVTLREIARLPGGVFPDGIAYDTAYDRLFVSDEMGKAVLAFDAAHNRRLARIDVGGEAGNVRCDSKTGQIFVAVQSKDRLAVIDPQTLRLTETHPLPGGRHPHGLIVAPGGGVGYVACDGDERLLTVDLVTGRVLSVLPVGRDPDVLAVDDGLGRLYVASESGLVSTFDISQPTEPKPLGDVFVGDNAHTLAIDTATHRLFFAFGNAGGQAVLRVLTPKP